MGRKSTKNGNKKTKTFEQPKLLLCTVAEKNCSITGYDNIAIIAD